MSVEKEAMWINFHARTPFLIKIYCGGVNAVSAEHHAEDLTTRFRRLKLSIEKKNIQDYIVAPVQPWLDGIASEPGIVRQFVAMPMGEGYTVEAQLTGEECLGGLQFEITPSHLTALPKTPTTPVNTFADPVNGDYSVVFKSLTGKTITVLCNLTDTILGLKTRYEDYVGIPTDQQMLIYGMRQLEDGTVILI